MEEGCKSGDDFSSDSSFDDDIDNISLLPDIERKPSRLRRRRIHLFTDRSFDFNGRMCSKTVVYTTVTAVLLVSVVFISIFVKPSSSEEFEENVPEKRSSKEPGPDIPPEDNKKIYKDKTGKEFPWQEIRLPNKVIPEKYRVEIQTDLTTFKFKGHVDMLLKCEEKTDYIFFHAKHMHLKNYSLYELGHHEIPKTLELGEITESTELEMISVKVSQELEPGKQYVLYVEFNSSLADQLFGFYKSSYKTKNGETRHIATTHFEPTDARAAFPCMDEPALKAKFEIIIIREKQYTALSNMPLKETINVVDDGREFEKDIFEESVLMSTYLVAFVVCDFKSKSARTTSNTLVRVWAPPDNIDEADFALEEAKNILAYYEEFFKVKFPLPKQDLIAIPDFAAGAMENWGLITYRSTSLLFDKNESSDSNKQWVATVVAHELAHQWFGNLVTMKWWNDLWLNEGFASFVENIGASHDNPQWKMMDQFLLDKAQLAMNLDQMSNSHPISVPVHNPSEINALFDTISYDKGASIIRMLRSIIGKEAFRHGLQNYLETYKFGNAETKDLWGKLSKAWQVSDSNARDISTIMDTWTLQMGYPVVNITRDNNQLTAAQQHFLIHPREKPALVSPYGYKWEIPLTYSTQVDKQELYVWMGKDGKDVVINLPAQSGWFKANYGQKGFYRVNYDKENWEALTQQLKADHTALSDADRSGLIDDAFSLARAGQLKLQTALELTLYLTKEKEYVPWTSALNNLGYIHSMLCTDDAPFNTMKKYLLQQLSPIVEELGWQDEGTHLQKYLRASALKSAVEYGHENAKNEAMRIFNEWKNSGKRIAPNLRAIIYSIGVQHGGKENYDFVFKQYKTATVASEKRKLMYALSSSEDLTVLQDLLDKSLDSAVVRSQDSVAVINAVAGNCKGRFLAWNFTKQHWGLLYKRYAAGSFDFSRLVLRTTSHFNTQIMLNEVKSFFDSHPLGSGKRASKQSLESIQANIDWMKRNKDTAVNWMGANTLMTPIEDVEKTLQQLEHINPNMADHEDRGYARNDYYYQDREEPRYGSDDYYRETGDNYRYEYR